MACKCDCHSGVVCCLDSVLSQSQAEVKEAKEAYDEASAIAKKWISRGDVAEQDRDHWKAQAEKLAETLKSIMNDTDETDGIFGLININHKRAKDALESYDKAREMSACYPKGSHEGPCSCHGGMK